MPDEYSSVKELRALAFDRLAKNGKLVWLDISLPHDLSAIRDKVRRYLRGKKFSHVMGPDSIAVCFVPQDFQKMMDIARSMYVALESHSIFTHWGNYIPDTVFEEWKAIHESLAIQFSELIKSASVVNPTQVAEAVFDCYGNSPKKSSSVDVEIRKPSLIARLAEEIKTERNRPDFGYNISVSLFHVIPSENSVIGQASVEEYTEEVFNGWNRKILDIIKQTLQIFRNVHPDPARLQGFLHDLNLLALMQITTDDALKAMVNKTTETYAKESFSPGTEFAETKESLYAIEKHILAEYLNKAGHLC